MSDTITATDTLPEAGDLIEQENTQEAEEAKPSRRLPVGIGILLLIFVGFLGVAWWRQQTSEQRVMGVAPDFAFTAFTGEEIKLADLQGKGVVVNFWASWCNPCRAEAALLEEAWRRERDRGIVFIGLDYLDQEHAAKAYLAEFNITYPNGPDLKSAAARRYRIQGVPETFFITPEGQIASLVIGPIVSESDLNKRLDAIRPSQ
jgi:cytochrome c biogenesis protein CcmG/thiol:disulfide interchange protein DsbE